MKVLFVCDYSLEDGKISVASWIKSILYYVSPETEICLLRDGKEGESRSEFLLNGRSFSAYILSPDIARDFSAFYSDNGFDGIVIFGSENAFSEKMVAVLENCGLINKAALFMQGVLGACARHYHEGVPNSVVRRYTLRDFLRKDNIAQQKKKMLIKAKKEALILSKVNYVIGRTSLDNSYARFINSKVKYYKCNDVLRSGFYDKVWDIDNCEKHTIFVSQYYYALKGFHYLLEAAKLLLPKYPDLKIVAGGYNPVKKGLDKKELKDGSYIAYIKKLAVKYGLKDKIELTGILDESDMVKQYLKCNVFVLPSTIENSPNSLAEAMTLGVPTVAADVGGVSDFATHKKDAFIYPSSEPYLLAYYIDKVFSDGEAAAEIGKNARRRGLGEYDNKNNIARFEGVLKEIFKG